MKTLKLSTLVFTLVCGAWLGCSSTNNGSGTGGSIGKGGALGTGGVLVGTGGALGTGGAVDGGGGTAYDAPMGGSEVGPSPEADGQGSSGGGTSGATGYVDCTGLTLAQCHDLIINPPTIQDCVVALTPGANPTVPYPNCSAQ
jgi:hypothetical protein